MKHIKLYEDYQDTVGAGMRDLFGLKSEFTIDGKNNMTIKFSGPSEGENEAKAISEKLGASASKIQGELDKIGWKADCRFGIGGFEINGPFIKWKEARRFAKEVDESAKYRCYKEDKTGDQSDDEYDEIYSGTVYEIMEHPETAKRLGDIGYVIKEIEW